MAISSLSGWYHFAFAIILIMLVATTILYGIAASQLTTTNTATSSSAIVANNKTAQSLFYGGMVAGIVTIIILIIVYGYTLYSVSKTDELLLITKELITTAQFSTIYYIFYIFIFILILFVAGLGIAAISYIDSSTNNSGGSSARSYGIGAVIAAIISAFFVIFMALPIYWYNQRLSGLLILPVVDMKPRQKSLAPYTFVSNPDAIGDFEGTITVAGNIKERPNYTYIDGQLVESDSQSTVSIPINDIYHVGKNSVPGQVLPVKRPITPVQQNQLRRRQLAEVDEKAIRQDQLDEINLQSQRNQLLQQRQTFLENREAQLKSQIQQEQLKLARLNQQPNLNTNIASLM